MKLADLNLKTTAFWFHAPATLAKMDLKLPAETKQFSTFGIKFWKLAHPLESNRADSALAIRCERRFAIRFTATNWTKKQRQLKLVSVFSSRSTKVNSLAGIFWRNK